VGELPAAENFWSPRLPFVDLAVAMKVADDEPDGTETLEGTLSAVLLLLSRFTTNSLEAALFRATVQVVVCPAMIVTGEQARVFSNTGEASVNERACDAPFAVAVITAVSSAFTADAVTVKAAEIAEAATVTLAVDSVALALLLDSATDTPPAGAAADSVRVQLAAPGAFTVAGVQASPLTVGIDPTVMESVLLMLPAVAVTVTS
jgi:hypothetical protein